MRGHWLRLAVVTGLAGSIGLLGSGVALADPPDHEHEGHEHEFHDRDFHGHDFHGRDFGHFRPEELALWRGGHWVHGWHDGRFAWWWDVGGFWYVYSEPVYPYPTYVPPAIVAQQAPPAPAGLPPTQSWYYCDNPQGYYPYVASCATPWHQVPAAPPGAAPMPQAVPPGPPPPPQ